MRFWLCRVCCDRFRSPLAIVFFLVLWAKSFLLANSAWGVDLSSHISQYRHNAWRMKDGYFRGQPRAIRQTVDGYLWIGTEAGLIRFDGVRLVSWVPLSEHGCHLPRSIPFWPRGTARCGSER